MQTIKNYIVITLVTLLTGVTSAASGIYMYKISRPAPLRLRLGITCPECRKTMNRGFSGQYVEGVLPGS